MIFSTRPAIMGAALNRARGALLLVAFLLSAVIGSVHVLLPSALILLPLPLAAARDLNRAVARCVAGAWFTLAAALLEWLGGARVVASGDGCGPCPPGERVALVICNHHCRIDWMFLWALACRQRCASRLCIALKAELRAAPAFGWAMQAFLFCFLTRRNREADLGRIRALLAYLAHERRAPLLLLLFPEGTDLSAANKARSQAHARAHGLAEYEHVLHPRSAGFEACVHALGERLDAVYDVDLWYEPHPDAPAERPSERSLLRGTLPAAVHAHVTRHARHALPTQPAELRAWLAERWARKEAFLAERLGAAAAAHPPPPARPPRPWLRAEYCAALLGWAGAACALLCALAASRALGAATLVGALVLAAGSVYPWPGAPRAEPGLDSLELALAAAKPPPGPSSGPASSEADAPSASASSRLSSARGAAPRLSKQ